MVNERPLSAPSVGDDERARYVLGDCEGGDRWIADGRARPTPREPTGDVEQARERSPYHLKRDAVAVAAGCPAGSGLAQRRLIKGRNLTVSVSFDQLLHRPQRHVVSSSAVSTASAPGPITAES